MVKVQGSNLSGQGMFDFSISEGDGYSLMAAFAAAGFAAVTFSIRGYGRSEAPADPFSVTETAMEDLDAVMAWTATQRASLAKGLAHFLDELRAYP